MNWLIALLMFLQPQVASQTPAPANQVTAAQTKDGWRLLFDGKTLDGWRGYKKVDTTETRWMIADGMLCLSGKDGTDTRGQRDIITRETYDQFELMWEWRVASAGNSGVKYFVLEDMDAAIGHEYQIIDDERHPDARIGPHRQTSALYDVAPASNRPLRPAGQFNQSRIVARGTTVEHWLNGAKVLEYELGSPALKAAIAKSKFKDVARFGTSQKGHLLLQDHGDAVCYRNIAVRTAPATPSPPRPTSGSWRTPAQHR